MRSLRRVPLPSSAVISSLHVASGALVGALSGSRLEAAVLGPLAHLAGDRMPHHDIPSRRFELASSTAAVLLLAAARGPLDPAVVGGVSAALPDVEHILRLPRPGGRKLFPSHRLHRWHRGGGVPAWVQLVAAGAILGALSASTCPARSAGSPPRGLRPRRCAR